MKHWLLAVLLLLGANLAWGQREIAFDDALDIMLENNPQMEGAWLAVDKATATMRATKSLRWPALSLSAAYIYMQRNVEIDLAGPKSLLTQMTSSVIEQGVANGIITPDVATFLGDALAPLESMKLSYKLQNRAFGVVGLQMQMPIYMGGRINIANRAAKMQVDIEEFRLTATESALMTQLVERYYGVILARDVVAVRRDAVASVQQHLDDAVAMEEAGVLTHSAVVYLRYRLSEAQQELSEAEHQFQLINSSLRSILNVDYAVVPIGKIIICDELQNLDYYLNMSKNLNPILCEADVDAKLANEGVKLARAELLPEVVAMGGGSLYDYKLSDMMPRWAVGVGVNFKIFDGLGKERRLKAAKIEAQRVGKLVENAVNNIGLLVEKEYYSVVNAKQNIEISRRLADFANSYYESLSEGFREGVVAAADLMDAQVELAASQVGYLNALYDYMVAKARLLEAAGMSLELTGYRFDDNLVNTLYK